MHTATRAAIKSATRLGLESLRAEVPQRLSDWAADHFKLAGESSHQKGAWEAWAFQLGLLDFMSDDRIEDLAVMKSKRVGYTKMVTALVCYNIAHRRRKQAIWQPTDDDRDSYVKSEIDPVFDAVDAIKAARKKGKGHEDTIKYKQFRDCALHLLGGKAAAPTGALPWLYPSWTNGARLTSRSRSLATPAAWQKAAWKVLLTQNSSVDPRRVLKALTT